MSDHHICEWVGVSGTKYQYTVYLLPKDLPAKPGNYVFCKIDTNKRWIPIYMGQTENLSERFDGHHAMPCIKNHQATHIHVHVNVGGKQARLGEEKDLLRSYRPPCNG
ncbi:hypothetical protein PbB2_03101 [Candidatus Phycosocius bacilliformis]|uniref:GIY-YIG domain-containing protein n=1 Tax=Candidatus Phycosocius bacilliformis TaxID=1445552 RepID=A0A2P2EEB5_9PROT|nr:GIY-YIG nuclease family protein [Candidatus Phycosocius bacilliformis]GBF59401.1 hypothetical protein PbB2_03101 [Candidatus Phycosocius bacilliformis]